jgi:pimeloyl-ACP methyl ester carboxylesterase
MHIYRDRAARAAVRAWCERALDGSGLRLERLAVPTSLGSTHVTRAGRSGPPVVMLPGTGFNAATSLPLLAALSRRFRVAIVDVPGQPGLSAGNRPEDDRIGHYRRWFDEVLGHLDAPVAVVGHSLGAALALCATPGPRVWALVLACPAGLISANTPLPVMRAALPWFVRPTPARSARLLTRMSGHGQGAGPELVEWMTLVGRSTRTGRSPAPLPGAVLEGWRTTPVAVLAGNEDPFFPPAALAHRARLWRHGDFHDVPGCGHLLPYESPETVVDAVASLTARRRRDSRPRSPQRPSNP